MIQTTARGFKAKTATYFVKKAFALAAAFLCFGNFLCAQTIQATLDRDKIVLGEQVVLELKVEGVNTANTFITAWFNLPDTANHIEVIKKDTVDTIEVNGLTTYLQHITLTSFDSGRWAVRLPKLALQDKATGKKTLLKTDSVYLQVLPVDVSNLKDYHDIKDIIDVPVGPNYLLLVLGILSAVAAVILVWLFFRRKPVAAPVTAPPQEYIHPLEEALLKIEALRKEGLPLKGQTKLFYFKLDDICRAYFNRRVNIGPLQSTGDELAAKLSVYLQEKGARANFLQLTRLVDAVKFAKYLPGEQQNEQALQLAISSLQHIEKQLQLIKTNVN